MLVQMWRWNSALALSHHTHLICGLQRIVSTFHDLMLLWADLAQVYNGSYLWNNL